MNSYLESHPGRSCETIPPPCRYCGKPNSHLSKFCVREHFATKQSKHIRAGDDDDSDGKKKDENVEHDETEAKYLHDEYEILCDSEEELYDNLKNKIVCESGSDDENEEDRIYLVTEKLESD